ncbi:MAG: Ku protein [Phycisphaerae bacterium]
MGRRAFYKGIIQFGSIAVPVKLYAAIEDRNIHFHTIHDQDKVRLKQQMVCLAEDKPVESDELVKGLQVGQDEYVRVEPQQLDELAPESSRVIEVKRFVSPEQIDPRYYDRPYHLGPDGDVDAYRLLRRGLAKTKRVGICSWTMRKRDYDGVLELSGQTLGLVTLHYPDEVAEVNQLDLPKPEVKAAERKTARYLIDELADAFQPEQYDDEFRRRLAELVRTKAEGKTPKPKKIKQAPPEVPDDLQAALEASLQQARKNKQKSKG